MTTATSGRTHRVCHPQRRRPEVVWGRATLTPVTGSAQEPGSTRDSNGAERASWTFLTNHLHVLLCIARDPTIRLRDVATLVGITERAAQSIVADLVAEGYLSRSRVGRRNHYEVHAELPLRHPLERDHSVSELLQFLNPARGRTRTTRSQAS